MWKNFEAAVASHPETVFWWRDDDIAWINPVHPLLRIRAWRRLKWMLDLLDRRRMPTLAAAVPYRLLNHVRPLVKLLEGSEALVAVHGLRHKSRSVSRQNEFPQGLDGEKEFSQILDAHREFRKKFGARAVAIFVPPYNASSPNLEALLRREGFMISKSNLGAQSKQSKFNVDYDFVDWKRRRFHAHEKILGDLASLVRAGRPTIGLNGHHKMVSGVDRPFLERLLEIVGGKKQPDFLTIGMTG